MSLVKGIHGMILFYILITTIHENKCYEKTLRKIVRNQSKMVQRPFSDTNADQEYKNPKQAQMKSVLHKVYRPKMSTILTSTDVGRSKAMFSRAHSSKNDVVAQYDLRSARFALIDSLHLKENPALAEAITLDVNSSRPPEIVSKTYNIRTSKFFPPLEEKVSQSIEQESMLKDVLYKALTNNSLFVQGLASRTETRPKLEENAIEQNLTASIQDTDDKPTDFFADKASTKPTVNNNKKSLNVPISCSEFNEAKADIDAQEKFAEFDIEPSWMVNKHFWSNVYDNRYEALMRNAKWPALKIILVPRTHYDTIWKSPFEDLHKTKARRSISNIVKKLQFYSNLTFSWNEVSHLSQWWKGARQKTTALRSLVEEGRLEITTGGWVETDEATSHLFGILHQLIEGHQWLLYNLNYSPEVAWVTNSVTHSPTLPYLLSSSGIQYLVLTNLHYSWQQYLTEYQCTDFVWVQSWDMDRTAHTHLNEALNRIGNDRYSKHSVLTHFLPFNSDGYRACGPLGDTCSKEFDFAAANDGQDIITSNVKEKTERLLEQYSKTGTTSTHNVVISPLGDKYRFESQTEFDFLYNNYHKIADYVNINYDIYKATVSFGTSKDYFENILARQKSFPTLRGDFLNFADISDASPAYWTGFFTSRPLFKTALRRLQSTLRSTEILFSFALNLNAFKSYEVSTLYERLLNAREAVARFQDRHVVGGTLSVDALSHARQQTIITAKDCWRIQETAASLLSSKPNRNETFLEKYIYRDGEFIASYKSVKPGEQIYVFNSINQDRIEIVELITREPNVRILDHNGKEVPIQINPVWELDTEKLIRISSQFFKIIFVANVPPLAFVLYKIIEVRNTMQNAAATIYCASCGIDKVVDGSVLVFNLRPFQTGDIQLENHKLRLIIDEYTGFLKTIIPKSDSEKPIVIDFGAFKIAKVRSSLFLFRTNTSELIVDVLSPFRQNAKSTGIIIMSGQVTTELTTIYGRFLHHTVKIFHAMDEPLSEVVKLETKIDNDAATEYRDMEMFLSIQTNIENGNSPELFIDNNAFQQTARTVNVSRPVEANVYPFTSMAYVQDDKTRLTIITDHAQGVTALQEGQLTVMLGRKVFIDDKPYAGEGVAENSATIHNHYLLIETFAAPKKSYDMPSKTNLKLPSRTASYLADTLDYDLDIYIVDANRTHLCNYAFMPLIKTSFPCEVALINYRVVLNRGTPEKYVPNTALMTLHRRRFCCALQSVGPRCVGDSALKLDSLLRNVRAVYQTNLVGTTEGVPINVLNKVNFPPSELTTLRIYF